MLFEYVNMNIVKKDLVYYVKYYNIKDIKNIYFYMYIDKNKTKMLM